MMAGGAVLITVAFPEKAATYNFTSTCSADLGTYAADKAGTSHQWFEKVG
jgi:hypothetical protein